MFETKWERLNTFFAYPQEVRRIIYVTNAIESMNSTLWKVTKYCGSFPNDEAGIKLLYMAIRNIAKKMDYALQKWALQLIRCQLFLKVEYPSNK